MTLGRLTKKSFLRRKVRGAQSGGGENLHCLGGIRKKAMKTKRDKKSRHLLTR